MMRTFKIGDRVTATGEAWPSLAGQRGVVINVWLASGRLDYWQNVKSRANAEAAMRYDVQFPDMGRVELGLEPSALLPMV